LDVRICSPLQGFSWDWPQVSIEIRCAENGDGALHKPLRDAERCKSGDADGEDGHPAAKLWDRV